MANNSMDLIDWFGRGEDAWLDHGDAVEFMHATHPRSIFVKSLRRHAKVLDVGAGDGALEVFRSWPRPARSDLRLYAYALQKGDRFDAYDGYELGEWPTKKPVFDGMMFDAIVSAHFIEHIEDPFKFLDWAVSRLASGGRLYVEWPTDESKEVPAGAAFRECGIGVTIGNFHDDPTHLSIPSRAAVIKRIQAHGSSVLQQGVVSNPYMEEEMIAHHRAGNAESYSLQAALWSRSKWAQYVVAEKT